MPNDTRLVPQAADPVECEPPTGPSPQGPGPSTSFVERNRSRLIITALLVIATLVSFFPVGNRLSDPAAYTQTIQTLDQKKDTVMGLVAGSSATAAAISVIPGDTGTPIANKLVDISADLLIVLAAIYLEKYLLTVFGFTAFKVVIPAALAFFAVALWVGERDQLKWWLRNIATRALLLAVCAVLVVPTSTFVSNMIDDTYENSINQTLADAQEATDEIESASKEQEKGESNWLTDMFDAVASGVETLTKLPETIPTALNGFIEGFAVMVVTSCLIPIIVLLFYSWVIRMLMGIQLGNPRAAVQAQAAKLHRKPKAA